MNRLNEILKMWKSFQILSFTLFTILLLNTSYLFAADTGEIRGKVVDVANGEELPFANIMLEGTSIGTATDSKGFYKILNVPAGNYNMIVKFIGYNDDTLAVTIVADQIVEQNVELRYGAVEMGEVTITGQAAGQVEAINRQLNANSVMNVVSSDRLQELPDANLAESVGRIPGVSIQREAGEASKVVIRGLEPKLNAITVNGVRVPATSSGVDASATRHAVSRDQGDRAVDLSMMTGDLLEAVEVFKAPTPDMDAEAVGGIVNLKVKKAPDEMSILVRANGGFNQLNDDFSNYKFVGQYGQRFFDNKLGLILGGNAEKINRGSERYEAQYNTDGVRDSVTGIVPVLGQNMRIRDTEEIRERWGAYLTLDYKYNDGVIWLTNFYSKTSRDPFSITKRYDPNAGDSQIRYDVRYQEIDLAGYSNALNGEHLLFGMDIDWVLSRYNTKTTNSYDMEMEYTGAARWDYSILDPKDIDTYIPAANDSLQDLYLRNSFFRPDTTEQTDYSAQLNFQVPFVLAKSISGFLKFGGKYMQSERERIAISRGIADYYQGGDVVANAQALHPGELTINSSGRIEAANFITSGTDSRKILDGEYELFPIFDRDKLKDWYDSQNSTYFSERFPLSDEYDLKETIGAGYVMAKLNGGEAWTVIPGVRYERSDNTYNAVYTTIGGMYGLNGITKDTTSTVDYDNWFPHLHIKYKPVDWFDIRVAALKTIARPNYYWLLPWTRINTENTRIDRGNPDLKPGISWNYELSSSFYSSHIGLFTLGGFYKDMTDIFFMRTSYVHDPQEIEDLQIPGGQGGYQMRSYFNAEDAKVYGFEIDLQTQLFLVPGIPDFLRGIVLNLNYSRIYSEAHYPHASRTTETDYTTWPPTTETTYHETTREASLVGQADQIFNMSLGYDVGGFSARLSLLYQGASLEAIGTIVEEDRWDDDFWRWDASLKYALDNGLSFFFNLAHITGQPDRTFFGVSDRQTQRSYYGMTGDIGIQFIY